MMKSQRPTKNAHSLASRISSRNTPGRILILLLAAALMYFGTIVLSTSPTVLDYEKRLARVTTRSDAFRLVDEALANEIERTAVPGSLEEALQLSLRERVRNLPPVAEGHFLLDSRVSNMSDTLCARLDLALADFADTIHRLKRNTSSETLLVRYAPALSAAARVDGWQNTRYWQPLLRFLLQADTTVLARRLLAAEAVKLAQRLNSRDDYDAGRAAAVAGLRALRGIPDARLYLDLCYRLQRAIWLKDWVFNLTLKIAEWIVEEAERAGYPLRATSLEYNIGNQFAVDHRYFPALAHFERVNALIERYDVGVDPRWNWYRAQTLERMAEVHKEIGDLEKAEQFIEAYRPHIRSDRDSAWYHKVKAEIAMDRGDYKTAGTELDRAWRYVVKKDGEDSTISELSASWSIAISRAYLLNRNRLPDRALGVLRAWEELMRRSHKKMTPALAIPVLIWRAEMLADQGRIATADSVLQMAASRVRQLNSPRLSVQQHLLVARSYAARQRYTQALATLQEARDICRRYQFTVLEIRVVLQLAGLARRMPARLDMPDMQAEILAVIRKLRMLKNASLLVDALTEVIQLNLSTGQPLRAQRYADELLAEVRALSSFYRAEQYRVLFGHSMNRALKVAVQPDISLGEKRLALQKLSSIKGNALLRATVRDSSAITLEVLQASLQKDEALLDFLVMPDTLYAFALRRSGLALRKIPIGRAGLQTQVQQYLDLLQSMNATGSLLKPAGYARLYARTIRRSHVLYRLLLARLEPDLRAAKKLYIVPDEILYALPFATLACTPDTLQTEFLVHRFAITYLPGAWALARRTAPPLANTSLSLFASIDPAYAADALNFYGRLEYVLATMHSRSRTQWMNTGAVKETLQAGYGIYLFLAHARASWANPANSFIEIPVASGRQRLFYTDVDTLKLRGTDLIILAACKTTGSRIYLGSGLNGLQHAFLAAGARQVLATFWEIDATMVLKHLDTFFRSLQATGDAGRALQQMQLAAMADLQASHLFRKPLPQIWGAYSLAGTSLQRPVRQTFTAAK